jgi:branched-chain amino acid aminotransferase
MSVIDLLRSKGYEVTERPVTMDEIIEAYAKGTLEEAFGTGTAVGIAYIRTIGYDEKVIKISEDHPLGHDVNDTLNRIKTGKEQDTFRWMVKVM